MHPLHTRKARSCRNQVPQPSWSLSAEPDILHALHDASSAIATRAESAIGRLAGLRLNDAA
jgi:hypothetical protein